MEWQKLVLVHSLKQAYQQLLSKKHPDFPSLLY